MREKSEEWVRIEVKDDGAGIPDHVMKKLFTPFMTTKSLGNIQKSGTGLGLSVVKKVVDSYKGYIHVHTKKDKGTTFIIDLPVDINAAFINTAQWPPHSCASYAFPLWGRGNLDKILWKMKLKKKIV